MDTFNFINTIATAVNDSSVVITGKLSRIILDTTLDNYLDTGNKSAGYSVNRWIGIDSERNIYYCYSCNFNMCVLCHRTVHQVSELISQKIALKINIHSSLINMITTNNPVT